LLLVTCYLLAAPLPAQNSSGADTALNLNTYAGHFGFEKGQIKVTSKYILSAQNEDKTKFGSLEGRPLVDTPLEFALLSYYSPIVVENRPVEAAKLLPANSRESEVKLGAATYSELQEIRFLDPQNSGRIGRYEGMLKFITDKQKITQAEISASLRASIHAVVDAEFNKISFFLNVQDQGAYNAVLTRNPKTGQYILSYERPSAQNDDKELTAPTLEALLDKIWNRTSPNPDFSQASRVAVEAQAALIPAVVRPAEVDRAKQALVNFYTTPNNSTFRELVSIYNSYSILAFSNAFSGSIHALNPELATRVVKGR
jgi:hypothetical protein